MDADSWVVGTVSNRKGGKAISAVSLTLYFQEIEQIRRPAQRSRSDKNGLFAFGPIKSGTYCLLASSFGYHAVAQEFTLKKGKRDTVNIVLEQMPVQTSMQRCNPERASIRMCPLNADSAAPRTDRTRCAGQP